MLPEGLVAWAIARLSGRPVLVYAHGEELTNWGRGRKFALMRFVFRHADAVLSNSDFTRDTLVDLLGVDPGRIAVVYPTVDEERFRPGLAADDLRASVGVAQGKHLILSVGRLQRRKGFDNVIRALPLLQRRGIDAHYALIGIGDDREYLQRLAVELGVSDRVHLLGHVSYDDLPRWYAACDLFAMPNRDIDGDNEGFGLVYLEAACAGKPALAGIAGGTGSAVVDGVTGLRVDGERLEAIAEALARLLENPADAATNGNEWARPRTRELYSPATRGPAARTRLARPLCWRRSIESARKPVADGVKGVELESVRSAFRCRVVQQLDVVADAGRTPGIDVGILVTHQHRARQVEVEVALCLENHARIRLAVGRFAPICADTFCRMIRAVIDATDANAMRSEFAEHPLGQRLEVLLGVIAAADAGLVGDDDREQGRCLRRAAEARRSRAGTRHPQCARRTSCRR